MTEANFKTLPSSTTEPVHPAIGTVPVPPVTFETFRFTTIGKPPSLLTRFSDADSELLYPPASPDNEEMEASEQEMDVKEAKPLSRLSLLETLGNPAAGDPALSSDSGIHPVSQLRSSLPSFLASDSASPQTRTRTAETNAASQPSYPAATTAIGQTVFLATHTDDSQHPISPVNQSHVPSMIADDSDLNDWGSSNSNIPSLPTRTAPGLAADAVVDPVGNEVAQSTLIAALTPFKQEIAKQADGWTALYAQVQIRQGEVCALADQVSQTLEEYKHKFLEYRDAVDNLDREHNVSVVNDDVLKKVALAAIEEYKKQVDQALRAQRLQEKRRLADLAAAETRRLEEEQHHVAEAEARALAEERERAAEAAAAAAQVEASKVAEEYRQAELAEAAQRKLEEERRAAELRALDEQRKDEETAAREREAVREKEEAENQRRAAEYEARRAAMEAERNREADAQAARIRERLAKEKQKLEKSVSQTPSKVIPLQDLPLAPVLSSSAVAASTSERVSSDSVAPAITTSTGAQSPASAASLTPNSMAIRPLPVHMGSRLSAAAPSPPSKTSAAGGFVPAQTEAGKTVSTDMPFSSIQLASEAKRASASTQVPGAGNVPAQDGPNTPTRSSAVSQQQTKMATKKAQDQAGGSKVIVKSEPDAPTPPATLPKKANQAKKVAKKAKQVPSIKTDVSVKREASQSTGPAVGRAPPAQVPASPAQPQAVMQQTHGSLPNASRSSGTRASASSSSAAVPSSVETARKGSNTRTSTAASPVSAEAPVFRLTHPLPPHPATPLAEPMRRPQSLKDTVPSGENSDASGEPTSASGSRGQQTSTESKKQKKRAAMDHYSPPPRDGGWAQEDMGPRTPPLLPPSDRWSPGRGDHYSPPPPQRDPILPPYIAGKRPREYDPWSPDEDDLPPRQRPRYEDGPSYAESAATPPSRRPRISIRRLRYGAPLDRELEEKYLESRYRDYDPRPYGNRGRPPTPPPYRDDRPPSPYHHRDTGHMSSYYRDAGPLPPHPYRDGHDPAQLHRDDPIAPWYPRGEIQHPYGDYRPVAQPPASPPAAASSGTSTNRGGKRKVAEAAQEESGPVTPPESDHPSLLNRLSNPSRGQPRTSGKNQRAAGSLSARVGGRAGASKPLLNRIKMA
ncbi:hypothetical protein OE88DRAFT_1655877 [Heliocybe sulcata]|uniref:Uncharacterized protein n=1 Tax=Heliocybe sulcata TaxID=5364 RepID=A0A5C3NB35_9AGAM|nr:hypothetical protein OE88DRAFT_1655877 [Heliocybe sulcata]